MCHGWGHLRLYTSHPFAYRILTLPVSFRSPWLPVSFKSRFSRYRYDDLLDFLWRVGETMSLPVVELT